MSKHKHHASSVSKNYSYAIPNSWQLFVYSDALCWVMRNVKFILIYRFVRTPVFLNEYSIL
jgi:hypothetical protein